MSHDDEICACGKPHRRVSRLRITHTNEHGQVRELAPVPATFLPFGTDPYGTGMLCEVRRAAE